MNEPNPTSGDLPRDDLEAVARLLAKPPPRADVTTTARAVLTQAMLEPRLPRTDHSQNGWRPPAQRPPKSRRWPGWLAPVAAAAAVAVALGGLMVASNAVQHRPAAKKSAAAAVSGQVPPYFVTAARDGSQMQRVVVGATATGAELGSVAPPSPGEVFTDVAAAGDDRTFILATQRADGRYTTTGPSRFYRLTLSGSGRPGRLAPLPIPPQDGIINGFALSPDGSKLAVSFLKASEGGHSMIRVFATATGNERQWVWPGSGYVGLNKPQDRSLSWAADNQMLLFKEEAATAQFRLLDTATPGGSLTAASKPLHIPSVAISGQSEGGLQVPGPVFVIGDGTRVLASVATGSVTLRAGKSPAEQLRLLRKMIRLGRIAHDDKVHHASAGVTRRAEQRALQASIAHGMSQPLTGLDAAIVEFSARTGKPVEFIGRQQPRHQYLAWTPDVLWANASGSVMITHRALPVPIQDAPTPGKVPPPTPMQTGVQTSSGFTPLPKQVQQYYLSGDLTW